MTRAARTFDGGGMVRTQFTGRYLFFNGARFSPGHVDFRGIRFGSRRVDFSSAVVERGRRRLRGGATFVGDDVRFRGGRLPGAADFWDAD